MKSFALASALAAASIVSANPTRTEPELAARADSLPTVTASGNAFWAGKERFYVRGIDYQPGGASDAVDPLADTDICKRDLAKFKELGINTIRVYITDNSADHDECMKLLADEGIYVILDANNPLYSINRYAPRVSYNQNYLQSVFATIDAFAKYPNTLAFFSGNEVVNEQTNSTDSAPYVKATTRDMRAYIKARGLRPIPVGYSAADVSRNRVQLAKYFNCGTDDERSDFFAFNDYSWCSSDYKTAGWDAKVKTFKDYGLPIFLSEYGCNLNKRDFGEIEALMSDDMTGVYSGGLMFEYSQGDNKYGIVDIKNEKVSELPEFKAFAAAMKKYPAPSGNGGAATTTHSSPCPTKDSDWDVEGSILPAIPEGAKAYFKDGAGTGPGLKGSGSQNGGGDLSPGDAEPGSGSGTASGSGSGSGDNKNAGSGLDKTPFFVSSAVFLMTLAGAVLL